MILLFRAAHHRSVLLPLRDGTRETDQWSAITYVHPKARVYALESETTKAFSGCLALRPEMRLPVTENRGRRSYRLCGDMLDPKSLTVMERVVPEGVVPDALKP